MLCLQVLQVSNMLKSLIFVFAIIKRMSFFFQIFTRGHERLLFIAIFELS